MKNPDLKKLRYSANGSDAFEASTKDLIAEIGTAFSKEIPQALVCALVLGGGYGRGEGGVLIRDNIETLYNDLDFFVFTRPMTFMTRKKLITSLRHLHLELTAKYGIDVDFSIPIPVSKLPTIEITQMLFDLFNGHKVVLGNANVLAGLPRWSNSDIPLCEALRLLLNRAMGLFFAKEKLASPTAENEIDFIYRNIQKAFQALADAMLIAEGNYDSSALVRIALLRELDLSRLIPTEPILPEIIASMEFKLSPHIPTFNLEELQSKLELAIVSLKDLYYALWSKELTAEINNYDSLALALRAQAHKRTLKNYVLNARDFGFSRITRMDFGIYPRYRLYLALPYFLFEQTTCHADIYKLLVCPQGDAPEQLRNQFVRLWQRYN